MNNRDCKAPITKQSMTRRSNYRASRMAIASVTIALCAAWTVSMAVENALAGDADYIETVATRALDRARAASLNYDFTGNVTTTWTDKRRTRTRSIAVEAIDGVLSFGDGKVMGDANERVRRDGGSWLSLWDGASAASAPDARKKYVLRVVEDENAVGSDAGSTTEPSKDQDSNKLVITAAAGPKNARRVHYRLVFDTATGLLLSKTYFDERGETWREMHLDLTSEPTPRTAAPATDLPGNSRVDKYPVRVLPAKLVARREVGNGFVLTSAYQRKGGGVHMHYSDGLVGMSVFQSPGEIEWSDLQKGGEAVELEGADALWYSTAAGTVVIWENNGSSYSAVSEAPLGQIVDVINHLLPQRRGTTETVIDFLAAPFTWN